MEARSKIFIICGPSGVGKGTLINMLLKDNPGIFIPTSYTTREKRPQEQLNKYCFVTDEEFVDLISAGKLVEYKKEHGDYYGTEKGDIESALKRGETVVIDIDAQGAEKIKSQFPFAKTVLIVPKTFDELEGRIRNDKKRGNTIDEEELHQRLEKAKQEIEYKEKANYVVVNGDGGVDEAYGKLKKIIAKMLQ